MKNFDLVQADQPADALKLKSAASTTRFIAGGTNLVDLMKYGIESPDTLVDISRLPLDTVAKTATGVRIGALARNSDVAVNKLITDQFPLLAQALLAGASPQLRNMATMGGNLMQRTRCYYFYDTSTPCNKRNPQSSEGPSGCGAIGGFNRIHAILGASSSCIATNPSDMNVALSALDAIVQIQGPNGNRSVPLIDFHRLPGNTPQRDNVLETNELIVGIDLPTPRMAGKSHYQKVRDRASYAFALVSVATRMAVENGTIRDIQIALGGVAHKPWRMPAVEKQAVGQPATEATFREVARQLLAEAKPQKDNAFKIKLAENTIVRSLQTVL
ncbi:FAD binding domain-containing protein [Spirosoma agri]|uniref:Xanthine dehydrogenase family protein subunit M n=1 Tax=Spirosoma agri TaxID=1987381 RepID=A0A6M0ISD5_9BACT|nr:xanthine dehydrogenase family protein subunit M [Spirosoma agri]NEU70341.1 xanthine dehydrogenase family protein subunit M [Spirosoma agri]